MAGDHAVHGRRDCGRIGYGDGGNGGASTRLGKRLPTIQAATVQAPHLPPQIHAVVMGGENDSIRSDSLQPSDSTLRMHGCSEVLRATRHRMGHRHLGDVPRSQSLGSARYWNDTEASKTNQRHKTKVI